MKKKYTYLVYYQVGAKKGKFIVNNEQEVPEKLLITMASEKIEHELLYGFAKSENEKIKTRLRNKSIIQIEDITNTEEYVINLKFEQYGKIENNITPDEPRFSLTA